MADSHESIRAMVARWIITAELELQSAAHLSGGDASDGGPVPLLRDRLDQRPLLTGSYLAGALRSHLNDLSLGYGTLVIEPGISAQLFGDETSPSPLLVFDSRGSWPEKMSSEVRTTMTLRQNLGLADENSVREFEVLPPGTTFPLQLELVIGQPSAEASLLNALSAALSGLERDEIRLGTQRSRGLGSCRTGKWRARRFDLTNRPGWMSWLSSDHEHPTKGIQSSATLLGAINGAHRGVRLEAPPDRRERVAIEVDLQFKSAVLIRSPGATATAPEATHLQSGGEPILTGTSVAGALRARALRIARLVRVDQKDAERWVERLFGHSATASRLRVTERPVTEGTALRQTRVPADRFTGGVVEAGVTEEEPLFRGKTHLRIEIRRPRPGEMGLVLLVVKDLLSGDLVLGGGAAVGRGTVMGRAEIILSPQESCRFDSLTATAPETAARLNRLVEEFRTATVSQEAT